jgi:hypothetical protein
MDAPLIKRILAIVALIVAVASLVPFGPREADLAVAIILIAVALVL